MIENLQLTSLIIGLVGGVIVTSLIWITGRLIRKSQRHSLEEMKTILKDSHDLMTKAADKNIRLYKVLQEIEGDIK